MKHAHWLIHRSAGYRCEVRCSAQKLSDLYKLLRTNSIVGISTIAIPAEHKNAVRDLPYVLKQISASDGIAPSITDTAKCSGGTPNMSLGDAISLNAGTSQSSGLSVDMFISSS